MCLYRLPHWLKRDLATVISRLTRASLASVYMCSFGPFLTPHVSRYLRPDRGEMDAVVRWSTRRAERVHRALVVGLVLGLVLGVGLVLGLLCVTPTKRSSGVAA